MILGASSSFSDGPFYSSGCENLPYVGHARAIKVCDNLKLCSKAVLLEKFKLGVAVIEVASCHLSCKMTSSEELFAYFLSDSPDFRFACVAQTMEVFVSKDGEEEGIHFLRIRSAGDGVEYGSIDDNDVSAEHVVCCYLGRDVCKDEG